MDRDQTPNRGDWRCLRSRYDVEFNQQPGFPYASQSADTNQGHLAGRLLELINQKPSHRLVTTVHQWIINPLFAHPLLGRARSQASTKAVQVALWTPCAIGQPFCQTTLTYLGCSKFQPETNRFILAGAFIAFADLFSLQVIQQRYVGRHRKGTLVELNRGAHIQQRNIVYKQPLVIAGILSHDFLLRPCAVFPSNGEFLDCA